jgi:hypothetical protein
VSDEFVVSMNRLSLDEKTEVADAFGIGLGRPAGDVNFIAPDGFYSLMELEDLSLASGYTVEELYVITTLTLDHEEDSYRADLVRIMLGETKEANMHSLAGLQAFQRYHGKHERFGRDALTTSAAAKPRTTTT